MRFFKQKINNSQGGFTLMELLVVTGLSGIIAASVGGAVIAQKNLYKQEVRRTKTNQNLRAIFDMVGPQVKLIGESLPVYFPAILLEDGGGAAPDTLVLRRNVHEDILNLRDEIGPGHNAANKTVVGFSDKQSEAEPLRPSFGFDANEAAEIAWNEYKEDVWGDDDGIAYMYNRDNDDGEFFDFIELSEVSNGGDPFRAIETASGHIWQNDYDKSNGQIYLLSEWKISLVGNYLRLVDSGDADNYLNLANNISDFQVQIRMQDGTVNDDFTAADAWQDIEIIEMLVESTDPVTSRTREWKTKFFPRNAISSLELEEDLNDDS